MAIIRTGNNIINISDNRISQLFKVVSNDEYIYAIIDNAGTFLFGIKHDGSVDWAKGLPEFLENVVNNKVDKIENKSLIDSYYQNAFDHTENAEYAFAITDDKSNILFGVKNDGKIEYAIVKDTFPNVFEMLTYLGPITTNKFKTMGFYEFGDFGDSTYDIVDELPTGTTIDNRTCFKMTCGKYAILNLDSGEFYVEQLGCKPNDDSYNVSSYILTGYRKGAEICRLTNNRYYINTILLMEPGKTLIGTGIGGDNHTVIAVNATYQGQPYGINVSKRNITIKNIGFTNNTDVTDAGACIFTTSYDSGYNKYNLHLHDLLIWGFKHGLRFAGEGKWCYSLSNIRISSCGFGVYIDGGFCMECDAVYTDHCDVAFRFLNTNNIRLTNCNIGIERKGIVLGSENSGETHIASTIYIAGCNFEYDESITNNPGASIYLEDSAGCAVTLVSNRFYFNPSYVADSTCSHISLGHKSKIILMGNAAFGAVDVCPTFDTTRTPKKEIGSVSFVGNNINMFPPEFVDTEYTPCVINTASNCMPYVDDVDDFISNYNSDGVLFRTSEGIFTIMNGQTHKIMME